MNEYMSLLANKNATLVEANCINSTRLL